jgi:hypothetical protein
LQPGIFMQIFASEQLGPTQSLTPEGYLICSAVPIARTGEQMYAAHELPALDAGFDGLIKIVREESEVFRPETIASFEGKSVTVNHTFVDPGNVKRVEVGHAQNVRRSEAEPDLLIADLLVKDARAIDLVRDGLREISCGYDAEYVQDAVGVAFQRNIIGNHVALVERGRAGPRCSIQDEEITIMPASKKPAPLLSRILAAMRSGDAALIRRTADDVEAAEAEAKRVEDEEAETAAEAAKKETADTIASLRATVDELIAKVEELTKDGDDGLDENGQPTENDAEESDDDKKKTADAMRDTVSRAEILAPGFKMPTADGKIKGVERVAIAQRKALSEYAKTADLAPLLAGRTVDAMSAAEVATTFVAASEIARATNNSRGARHAVSTKDFGPATTAAEINRRNAEFYKS